MNSSKKVDLREETNRWGSELCNQTIQQLKNMQIRTSNVTDSWNLNIQDSY